ncbi:MAG: biotin/lipoyl-binding protein, partial [Nannocystaceae bacterium]
MSTSDVSLSALDAVGSINGARVLAKLLLVGFSMGILGLFVVPWQQSVTGTGRVIAYTPIERQQSIDAPITGRVVRWHVQEGMRVSAGDPVVDLGDNDPDIQARLQQQRDAVQRQIDAATLNIAVAEAKIAAQNSVRSAAVMQAEYKRQIAKDRKQAAEHGRDSAEAAYKTATRNAERQRSLHGKGLVSTR